MSETSLSNKSNKLVDLNDGDFKYYSHKIVYYYKEKPLRLPAFNNDDKTLLLFAEKDIDIPAKKSFEYISENSLYLSNYLYNYSVTADFMTNRGLKISVLFIRSRRKQALQFVFHNYSSHRLKIYEHSAICKIRFVTHSNVQFETQQEILKDNNSDSSDNEQSAIAETQTADVLSTIKP